MTNVYYTLQSNKSFVLEAKGHAGFAEYGNDIVCSAISMLIQTLIAHMDNVADDFEARVEPGDVWLWGKGREAVMAAETIMTGFELLNQNFPDYIKVSSKGVLTNP